jgi:pimeloyl-ACP methyl ester carboxylesterase
MGERFETSDGIGIAWHEWGAELAGPPVVLHHGFGANAKLNWLGAGVIAALTAAGRRVIAVDARGHGESDKPHDPAFYGEDRMARDVSELIDHLGFEAFDLVGYSMGAIVSLIAGTREPRIRRLIIGGVGDGILAQGGVDTRVVDNRDIVKALLADDPADIPSAARGFRQLADATGADRKALAAQAQVVHASRIPLEDIKAQTLVLAGDADPLAARPERLAAAIGGAQVRIAPGDHRSVVAAPQFAAAMVEFLA